jgi:hypothetical protein
MAAQELTPEYLIGYFDAFSDSDFERMASYYHDDISLTFPGKVLGGVTHGKENIVNMFKAVQQMFRGSLKFHCTWAVAIGDKAVVQWFTSGYPQQGGFYKNRGAVIWTFKDGKIIDFQDYLDTDIVTAFVPGPPPADVDQLTVKAFHPEFP